jgi:hypothetical protein
MRLVALLLAIAACNPYDGDLGATPFLCAEAEPRCPRGYTCTQDPDDGREVCSDTAVEFNCADDSAREPNESSSDATSIDPMPTFQLEGAAICPAGDRDVYSLELSADGSIELLVTFQSDGATLDGAILDADGVALASAAALEGDPTTIRALADFLPPGSYFVEIEVPEASIGKINNYGFTINLLPCVP